jgi:hypothetical protein
LAFSRKHGNFHKFYTYTSDGGDKLLTGSRAVPTLTPGGTSTGMATVTISATTLPGTYFVLACADDLKKVVESKENNNCRASATQVTVQP